jgi:hypothetical protein
MANPRRQPAKGAPSSAARQWKEVEVLELKSSRTTFALPSVTAGLTGRTAFGAANFNQRVVGSNPAVLSIKHPK